jgi:hypothetical protein
MFLGRESDAERAVDAINALPTDALFQGGEMGGAGGRTPGPLGSSTSELWASWMGDDPLPWSQVHGHTIAYDSRTGWLKWIPPELIHTTPNPARRHCRFAPPGQSHSLVRIDPSLWEHSPTGSLHALVVHSGDSIRSD